MVSLPGFYKENMVTMVLLGGMLVTGVALSATAPDPARRAELLHLVRQDCGSCHGLTLRGGLGPALTKEALSGKAPVMLREVILHGRPGTPMAPWRSFLTEQEADWVVEMLIEGRLDAKQ